MQIVVGLSPIALAAMDVDADGTIVSYPNSRYFRAFDVAVLAAGYNSVAGAFAFRLRAVLFPNTGTGSDDQVHRAAAVSELACWRVMTAWDEEAFAGQIRDLLECDPEDVPLVFEAGAAHAAEQLLVSS